MIAGLREALAKGDGAAVVGIGSNSTTFTPGILLEFVERLNTGDEEADRARADEAAARRSTGG